VKFAKFGHFWYNEKKGELYMDILLKAIKEEDLVEDIPVEEFVELFNTYTSRGYNYSNLNKDSEDKIVQSLYNFFKLFYSYSFDKYLEHYEIDEGEWREKAFLLWADSLSRPLKLFFGEKQRNGEEKVKLSNFEAYYKVFMGRSPSYIHNRIIYVKNQEKFLSIADNL